MSNKLYLVTGGAGFIGSHIVRRLLDEGQRVRVLDNFSSGKEDNLSEIKNEIEIVRGDIRDVATVAKAVKDTYVVFHEAALGSVSRSVADPITSHESNITGTLNVLMAARDLGVRRVVYASSSSVYGETPELPKHEGIRPQPLSPYALTKLAGEQYCAVLSHVYGLETVALRYFNVFGPRQDPSSEYAAVIPRFVTAAISGRRPVIYGDGLQSRDFSYVDNVVDANLLASEAHGVTGQYFNIACGGRYSLLELLERINSILGSDLTPVHEAPRPGDVRDSQASIAAAESALGYKVTVDFEEGLRRTIKWYMEKAHKG
jgi:UDP-N-acetylglucosamine/UDP-N-acetyl-alpha-D-glucosaminouronate 4-epimerase